MSWTYNHNPTLEIVEVVFVGTITALDLQESTSELIQLEKEKGINQFLVDATQMHYSGSLTVVHDLPAKQYLEAGADRFGRVAVVLPTSPRDREFVQFYETVCQNRGWFVKAFSTTREAIGWLIRTTSSNNQNADDGV